MASKEQKNNTETRETMKLFRAKLICLLRYNGGLSIRKISFIVQETFGINCSTAYITNLCKKVNKNSKEKMKLINGCTRKKAKMLIFDETFPKIKKLSATNMAVAIDEFGLIRGLKIIINRKKELTEFLNVLLKKIQPLYFMSDYDKSYPKIAKNILPNIIMCKDFVHAIRTIYRDARTAINQVSVETKGNLTKSRKKEIKNLKKKLIAKRLYQVLYRILRGFKKENAQIGSIYILGGLEELKELAERFPSLQAFYKKTAKFVNKYIDIWTYQMELNFKENLPTTSNSIESKNSLFKTFRNNSKCFETKETTEEFFCAVALMENFSIKTRGKNKGTSAMTRAGVDLEELGGQNFFEVVGLEEIVLGKKSKTSNSKIASKVFSNCINIIEKVA